MSEKKTYHVTHEYEAKTFNTLFKNIPSPAPELFDYTLWSGVEMEVSLSDYMIRNFLREAVKNELLNLHKEGNKHFYSLTPIGEFIVNNIKAQPGLVWDIIHVHHLLLHRLKEHPDYSFSCFYNVVCEYVYNLEIDQRFTGMNINQEVLSKLKDKEVGFSEKDAGPILSWSMFLDPALTTSRRYIRLATDYCSIERVHYALTALYKGYRMELKTPLLIDDKVLEDIKLYLLVPKVETIENIRLLAQTCPDIVSEQTSTWGTSFILNEYSDNILI